LRVLNDYIDASNLPIQTVPLAIDLGIRVYKADWPNTISGKIQFNEDRGGDSGFAIFVNGDHPRVRRRFTIAHEIAHYILHEPEIGDGLIDDALYRSGLSSRMESQANQLAADILMPWQYLREAHEFAGDDIPSLAIQFDVSEQAMSIRLGMPT
jgi:Zn-dependent peptidase ImmA (M78 family)